MSAVRQIIDKLISQNTLMIFSKSYCPYCTRAKSAASDLGLKYKAVELDDEPNGTDIQNELQVKTGQRSVPNIFYNGNHIGGCDDFLASIKNGKFAKL
jgi:glutaredoxin 3